MKSFVSFLKPAIRLVPVAYLFFALPVLADDCGNNQRLDLPNCVTSRSLSNREGVSITNNCRFTVTIKVDIADAADKRVNINPRQTRVVRTRNRYKLHCCPMYSACRNVCGR